MTSQMPEAPRASRGAGGPADQLAAAEETLIAAMRAYSAALRDCTVAERRGSGVRVRDVVRHDPRLRDLLDIVTPHRHPDNDDPGTWRIDPDLHSEAFGALLVAGAFNQTQPGAAIPMTTAFIRDWRDAGWPPLGEYAAQWSPGRRYEHRPVERNDRVNLDNALYD